MNLSEQCGEPVMKSAPGACLEEGHDSGVAIGCRVCLVDLQKAELNGSIGVVVSKGDERIGIELEGDRRIAVRPANLEIISDELPGKLAVGSRVQITGLASRSDLNTRVGTIISLATAEGDRWGVKVGDGSVAIKFANLKPVPQPPDLGVPTSRASLHLHDLVLTRFVAMHGVAPFMFAEDRFAIHAAACLRQKLLYTWGCLPADPAACINLAVVPTLMHSLLAIDPFVSVGKALKVHCIGSTPDFEGCVEWSELGEFLAASGFATSTVEITCFGNDECFALPPGVFTWSGVRVRNKAGWSSPLASVQVHHVHEIYHSRERSKPDVVMLCHPGFDNYMELWHPTLDVLFELSVPVIVAGHSSFAAFSHDALQHQDLALTALGANIIQRQMWNPFCQAFSDPTKGSLMAESGRENEHCNLAVVSIFKGGVLRPLDAVNEFFDALDYLVGSVQGFPAFQALGPMLRNTGLHLKYPHMKQAQREAAVKLLRDLNEAPLPLPSTALELRKLLEQRGLASHFSRGRGNW